MGEKSISHEISNYSALEQQHLQYFTLRRMLLKYDLLIEKRMLEKCGK